ncbi:hypothetical protein JKP88DRAFT_255176 [Tribonema minus]|uniref:Uncharacterized protein n=1 Tax=Tribonema minus TaxID=303371 RepID=A0A835ZA08_9STRA|nr:hypothetical protein JKP88DRAFT_255173 [Tribonema minus]KAG5185076.1 hypothetical protein JKP88DRAFT_255176 [Tribonema minus]
MGDIPESLMSAIANKDRMKEANSDLDIQQVATFGAEPVEIESYGSESGDDNGVYDLQAPPPAAADIYRVPSAVPDAPQRTPSRKPSLVPPHRVESRYEEADKEPSRRHHSGRSRRDRHRRRHRKHEYSDSDSSEGSYQKPKRLDSESGEDESYEEEERGRSYKHADPARAAHEDDIKASMAGFTEFRGTTQRETEEQERIELLYRMRQLEKDGFPPSQRVVPATNLDEIRYELYRQTREANKVRGLKWLRQLLVTAARFLEIANHKVNPFELNLKGFSRSVALSVADYDQPLLAVHNHYSGRGTTMHPMLQLGLTLGGSVIFHHVTNSNGEGRTSAPPSNPMRAAAQQAGSNPFQTMGGARRRPMAGPPSDTEEDAS